MKWLKIKNINHKNLKCCWVCRVLCLYCSIAVLVGGVVLAFLFYDLHPLACINGQREQYYDYEKANESVKISFSNAILSTQRVVAFLVLALSLLFIINAYGFYSCSLHIIDIFTKHIEQKLSKDQDVTDDGAANHSKNYQNSNCCSNHTPMIMDCCRYFICDHD